MLSVRDLRVSFGETVAIDGVEFDIGEERVGVLGPSGCGKSTLLRVIAGLQRPDSGSVIFDGQDVTGLAVHQRGFGLMFQDYALFPHRDVGGNVGFGLEMQGIDGEPRRERVAEVLDLVGLPGWEKRPVDNLSGGEAQRVALARTLAPRPRLLLLDEPLGALDRMLRDRLVTEIREILERASTPALYVTHDHDEASVVSERILIMREGRIVQSGTLDQIRSAPADAWVDAFVGL
jgi:thiamine transport system ATP-binding protein